MSEDSTGRNPGDARRRAHGLLRVGGAWRVLAVGLIGAGAFWWWRGVDPQRGPSAAESVPVVDTARLEPAVGRLIDDSLRGVREERASGAEWGRLGSVLMHYEFFDAAGQAFRAAAARSPADPRWPYLHGLMLTSRDPAAAQDLLRQAADLSAAEPDAPRLRHAEFLAEHGQWAEAEARFQKLLATHPAHPVASLGLARVYQGQRKLPECTNQLAGALSNPHTARAAHLLLASVAGALGDRDGAARVARRAAALPADPPWPDPYWSEAQRWRVGRKAWIEDATALLDQGRFAETETILGQLAREYPEDEEGWYLNGWAFNQRQQPVEAERCLREHLRRSPGSPKGLAQLAVSLLQQGRLEEAIPVLEAAARLKPTWRELHSNLGYAQAQLGRPDAALAHYREALTLDPNHVPTWTALAELALRRGDRAEARRQIRQALELAPEDRRVIALSRRVEGP